MSGAARVADDPRVEVRGNASPEELAAVLAVARRWTTRTVASPDSYTRWRAARVATLRRDRTDHERRS